jgi:hypothetical protein
MNLKKKNNHRDHPRILIEGIGSIGGVLASCFEKAGFSTNY